MNIHERFREDMEARSEALKTLKEGSEEHKRASDEYTTMYKLALEHEKQDEEINDRRYRMEKDLALEYAKLRHSSITKLTGFALVTWTFISGIKLENQGYIKPKITDVLRIIKF